MREILFRGRCVDEDNYWGWQEGFYVCLKDYHKNHETHRIYTGYAESDCGSFYADFYEVDPETVGQSTGRTDKNGKKVFEHDILQTFTVWADGTVEKGGIGIVQWWEHDQCYVLVTKEGYHIDDFGNLGRPEYYEVIGNIHDNPELLGGADNG